MIYICIYNMYPWIDIPYVDATILQSLFKCPKILVFPCSFCASICSPEQQGQGDWVSWYWRSCVFACGFVGFPFDAWRCLYRRDTSPEVCHATFVGHADHWLRRQLFGCDPSHQQTPRRPGRRASRCREGFAAGGKKRGKDGFETAKVMALNLRMKSC